MDYKLLIKARDRHQTIKALETYLKQLKKLQKTVEKLIKDMDVDLEVK